MDLMNHEVPIRAALGATPSWSNSANPLHDFAMNQIIQVGHAVGPPDEFGKPLSAVVAALPSPPSDLKSPFAAVF